MGDHPNCYPGTQVLVNRMGLRDGAELEAAERLVSGRRMTTLADRYPITPGGMREIHRHLFELLYDWAGEYRHVTTGRGPVAFCRAEYIDAQVERRFALIHAGRDLKGLRPSEFAARAAEHVNEINAIHPFLEGNGRTQRAFLEVLARQAGHEVDLGAIRAGPWNRASVAGFYESDHGPMARVIAEAMVRERDGLGVSVDVGSGSSPVRVAARRPPSGDEREGGGDDGTRAIKLLVTSAELDLAIARSRRAGEGGRNPEVGGGPVVAVLAEGGSAVRYLAHRRVEDSSVPDRWVAGGEALERLRRDFGRGRHRSIEVRVARNPPPGGTEDRLSRLAASAEREAAGRGLEGRSAPKVGRGTPELGRGGR